MTDINSPLPEEKDLRETLILHEQHYNECNTQIVNIISQLRLEGISDDDKIKLLTDLIKIIYNIDKSELHSFLSISEIIDQISDLIIKTTNPRIRILCGTLIKFILQFCTETNFYTDLKKILSPFIKLLFNNDLHISRMGKQSLIDAIELNPEVTNNLIELNTIEQATELLDQTFNQDHIYSQQSQSSSDIKQGVILNILDVVYKILQSDAETKSQEMKLQIVVERIAKIELPFPIKVAIQQLLIILKFKEKDSNKSKILELTLLDAQEHIWITEEHLFVAEQGRKVAEEQVRIFEERIKVVEEQKQYAEEKQRILEGQKEQIEQQLIFANKEKNISEEIAKVAQEHILIVEQEKKAIQEQKREIEEQLKISEEKTRIEEMHLKEVQDQVTAKDSQIEHLLAEVAQLKHQPVQTIEHGDDTTAELSNPDSSGQGMSLERISGLLRKAVALKQEFLVVSLNKEIKNGIRSLTVRFGKCNFLGFAQGYVGIAKASYKIPYPCIPNGKPHCQNMLGYLGLDGEVCYKGQSIKGNSKFRDGQLITLELNYDDGTLHIFVDRKQQPIFVKGIKEAVKFWFQIWNVGSSFEIICVKKLENSTASKLQPNQKAINW